MPERGSAFRAAVDAVAALRLLRGHRLLPQDRAGLLRGSRLPGADQLPAVGLQVKQRPYRRHFLLSATIDRGAITPKSKTTINQDGIYHNAHISIYPFVV